MKCVATRLLMASVAAVIATAVVLSLAPPLAVTTAELYNREVMSDNVFTAFGPGPVGLSLEPGKSKATWVSRKHAPFNPIATPADGSLNLDFGEVTFHNSNMSPDVFRICNRSGEARDFEVVISPALEGLFRDVEIKGGSRVAPGSDASVRIGINGGARPPGSYSGTLVVRDLTEEFYRVVRVTVRILGTGETRKLGDAFETAPVMGEPEPSATPSETPTPASESTSAPEAVNSNVVPVPSPVQDVPISDEGDPDE